MYIILKEISCTCWYIMVMKVWGAFVLISKLFDYFSSDGRYNLRGKKWQKIFLG